MNGIPAVFVDTHGALKDSGGGVQLCNREYLETLRAAGFDVQMVPFDLDRRLRTRIANRLFPQLRPASMPTGLFQTVKKATEEIRAQFVFFGLTRYIELSRRLREFFPQAKQVLLSHGTECVDFAIEQRIRRQTGTENRSRWRVIQMLGKEILREAELRRYIDAALVLSPFEVELEKWLGTPAVQWVPRTVREPALEPKPVNGRVGCVATLDHPPNHDGLAKLFDALAGKVSEEFCFRVVGRPEQLGRALHERFPFVEYLGGLDDAALRTEAATWCCFVHPLFVNAKGCSTKLAMGLGWRLPVATTELGARGYKWDGGVLPLARTPADLAISVLERGRVEKFDFFQNQTIGITAQAPSLETTAQKIRQFLMQK
jgi:hypothetical protein